ncbi:ribosome hibernation-promoting factor, HPF/YfiA family [Autumnicola edwardsiae]|jgi:putative sigma-54 modulation protein|uniref:Ribosome-associated translation inhibitor RaiA n=1 Tax=Autumnicola edwardsiae TaxID=3075594 RepID=A0ABU3CU63_9FLAO|nr:ribosome-associated translation inhibitor RaiA [Zunongwangia sp. F297]MDT0649893.1 ribosome-associated translation inhibitor RaiA [Zunongwangia sp. F297]
METVFEYVGIQKSESLEEYTQNKLDKLERKYDFIVRAEVHFKKHENQDPKGHVCNIKVSVPGPQIFAQSNEESYEAAAAESVRDVEKQLEKLKAKMKTH